MNRQRVLSLVLALVMVLGAFGIVSAEEAKKDFNADAKIQWLVDNEVIEGRKVNENAEDNDLALDKTITRAEITKLIVYTLGKKNVADTIAGTFKPFKDVAESHWANGYITVASTEKPNELKKYGIIIGYPDGEFKPSNEVTYQELATMLVRVTKKDLTDSMEEDANKNWPRVHMRWAEGLGILDGLGHVSNYNAPAVRKDAFVMLYNAWQKLGKTKSNQIKIGDKLGVVSYLQGGKLQLNNDTSVTYDISNALFADGTSVAEFAKNVDFVSRGSLVRLIVDKDNKVERIVELGNYYDGALGNLRLNARNRGTTSAPMNDGQENSRWRGVADRTVGTIRSNTNRANAILKLDGSTPDKLEFGNITVELTNKTRYFVSDPLNNAFGEIKDSEILKYFSLNKFVRGEYSAQDVYAGYSKDGQRFYADVVVFNVVDEFQGRDELVRVVYATNSDRVMTVENAKGERSQESLANIPTLKNLTRDDYLDVFRTRFSRHDYSYGTQIIDHSYDNIYQIAGINRDTVTLRDVTNRYEVVLKLHKNVDKFESIDKANKGAIVQVGIEEGLVTAISVLPRETKLRGEFRKDDRIQVKEATQRYFTAYVRAYGDGFVNLDGYVINNTDIFQRYYDEAQVKVKGYDRTKFDNGQIVVGDQIRFQKAGDTIYDVEVVKPAPRLNDFAVTLADKVAIDQYAKVNIVAAEYPKGLQAPLFTVKYESLNPTIATVDVNGNVKGVSRGIATIKITLNTEYRGIKEERVVFKDIKVVSTVRDIVVQYDSNTLTQDINGNYTVNLSTGETFDVSKLTATNGTNNYAAKQPEIIATKDANGKDVIKIVSYNEADVPKDHVVTIAVQ